MKSKVILVLHFFLFLILRPLSWLWESLYRLRRFSYNYGILKQNRFMVPIISVGNLSFGGTGKTPFTLWLSEFFHSLDKEVLILMRGYKGKLEHSSGLIERGKRLGVNPSDFGDEALLLSRRLSRTSILVGKKRSENLEHYFEKVQPDVVILDDGHQHLKLARSLNIVLFDALMPLSRYKVAPMGYLREGLSALKDAQVVVFGRADQVDKNELKKLKNFLAPYMANDALSCDIRYLPMGLNSADYQIKHPLDQIRGLKVFCVAAIASPRSFFNLVESLGAQIVEKEVFPDHHYYSASEMKRILEHARRLDALVVTTEKDIVKMRRVVDDDHLLYLEVKMDFIEGEREVKEIITKTFLEAHEAIE